MRLPTNSKIELRKLHFKMTNQKTLGIFMLLFYQQNPIRQTWQNKKNMTLYNNVLAIKTGYGRKYL